MCTFLKHLEILNKKNERFFCDLLGDFRLANICLIGDCKHVLVKNGNTLAIASAII